MHRNVVRHHPRRFALTEPRSARCYSIFDYKQEDPSPLRVQSTRKTPQPSPDETSAALRELDQKTLLDTKTKLNALIAHFTALKTSVPKLAPATYRSPAGETAPYVLGLQRSRVHELPDVVEKALQRVRHTRAHIEDLQTEDYEQPGDGLAKWKEQIEAMGREEKEYKLKEMAREEEAILHRLELTASRNLELVRSLLESGGSKKALEGQDADK